MTTPGKVLKTEEDRSRGGVVGLYPVSGKLVDLTPKEQVGCCRLTWMTFLPSEKHQWIQCRPREMSNLFIATFLVPLYLLLIAIWTILKIIGEFLGFIIEHPN